MLLDWYVDNGTDEQVAIVSQVMEHLEKTLFKRGSKTLTIDIDFVNTPGGGCVQMDGDQYEIEINKRLVPKTLQRVLAHEMVHVKQYQTGRLTQSHWMGKPQPKVPYMEQPWEIEAYTKEKEIVNAMAA